MEDLYKHFSKQSLWEKYEVSKSPSIEVTEIWVESRNDLPPILQNRIISSADVDNWLEESPRQSFPASSGVCTRAVRILWVGQNPSTGRTSPSSKVLERLTEDWGLHWAISYAQSSFAGVSSLPGDSSSIYTITYHPKLAVTWSHTPSTGKNTAPRINVVIFCEGEERTELHRILSSTWSAPLATSPMFPALLSGLMLAHGLDATLDDIKKVVREVEARTGHHRFTSRRETSPAAGELGSLSANMSGCAAKLANGTRKLNLISAINTFIAQHTPSASAETWMSLLQHRAAMQQTDLTYTQSRIDVQIRALFHLIAQQDNAIAFDTASATRSIAASSLQDSSSMKMLALVAMFFLPGSFIAALFSTPLFTWDDGFDKMSLGTRPQFALFWAVTVPVTVAVFILYAVWMCIVKKKDKKRRNKGIQVMA